MTPASKKESYLERLYNHEFPLIDLCPRCDYCGAPVSKNQRFCSEEGKNCAYLYGIEINAWMDTCEKKKLNKSKIW